MADKQMTGLRFDKGKTDVIEALRFIMALSPSGIELYNSLKGEVNNVKTVLTTEQFKELPTFETGTLKDFEYLEDFEGALQNVVRLCHYGAVVKGYGKSNWREGMKYSRIVNPLLRHLLKYVICMSDNDVESGAAELIPVAWNALSLLEYHVSGLGENDLRKD